MQLRRIKNLEIFTISVISEVWFTTRTVIREPHLSQMFKNQTPQNTSQLQHCRIWGFLPFIMLQLAPQKYYHSWSCKITSPFCCLKLIQTMACCPSGSYHDSRGKWTGQFNQRFVTITIFPFQYPYSFQKLKCFDFVVLFGGFWFCVLLEDFLFVWGFFGLGIFLRGSSSGKHIINCPYNFSLHLKLLQNESTCSFFDN